MTRTAALPDEWGDAEYDAYGSLLGIPGDKVPRAGSGHRYDPLNFAVVGTFMRHPELAKAFLAFNDYQLQRSSLPVRWRELAILRVAHRRQSRLRVGPAREDRSRRRHHRRRDRPARPATTDSTEPTSRARSRPTNCSTTAGIGDRCWNARPRELDTHQVMDLIFVVGTYNMLAMAFETWRLDPEPDTAPLPVVRPAT